MSTDTAVTDADAHDAHGHDDHGEHMSDWQYIKLAILLAVLTAIEVATYFWDFQEAEVPVLLILMVIKFALVVGYFMHLRFDNKLFTRLFVTGMVIAVAVYIATLQTFEFF